MKKINELEDTLEQQEQKELAFELFYKIIPFIFLFIMMLICGLVKVLM